MKRCYICGKKDFWMREIKSIYRLHEFKDICVKCGDKANKFINYWGKKKQKDLDDLKAYLSKGLFVDRKFSQLVNGGYY